MGNDTHYRVHCGTCGDKSKLIYSGYDKSEYEYYLSTSLQCASCAADYNRRERERARQELEAKKRREEQRNRQKMAELERQKRAKLEREREEREFHRRLEQQRLMAQQQAAAQERMRKLKEMQQKQAEELKVEAQRMKELNDNRRNQSRRSHPLLQFKQLQTINTVKSICQQVSQCAVVGQVITDTVNDVADELKRSLKDEYSVIEPQMKRYEKYGQELSNMKSEFANAFENVFKNEEADINEFAELMEGDPESAMEYAEEMKLNMKRLVDGMNDMESKLFLMSQYYDQISLDYEEFMEFCSSKKLEFSGIPDILKRVAAELKNVKRDVNEGLNDDEKIATEVSVTYNTIIATEITENTTDWSKVGRYAAIGAGIGGGVGLIAGGPPGAIGGAVLGGLAGAVIGGIVGLLNSQKATTKLDNADKQCVLTDSLEKITYDGSEHSDALEKIIEALRPTLDEYAAKLEQQQVSAHQELMKIDGLKKQCESMQKLLSDFRKEARKIIQGDITRNQARMMKRKWNSFKEQINVMLHDMK